MESFVFCSWGPASLISTKRKEYIFGCHLCIWSIITKMTQYKLQWHNVSDDTKLQCQSHKVTKVTEAKAQQWQCNVIWHKCILNSNGITGHHDISTKAQLQQDKGAVVMTRPIANLKMNLCSPGLDAQTIVGASGTPHHATTYSGHKWRH